MVNPGSSELGAAPLMIDLRPNPRDSNSGEPNSENGPDFSQILTLLEGRIDDPALEARRSTGMLPKDGPQGEVEAIATSPSDTPSVMSDGPEPLEFQQANGELGDQMGLKVLTNQPVEETRFPIQLTQSPQAGERPVKNGPHAGSQPNFGSIPAKNAPSNSNRSTSQSSDIDDFIVPDTSMHAPEISARAPFAPEPTPSQVTPVIKVAHSKLNESAVQSRGPQNTPTEPGKSLQLQRIELENTITRVGLPTERLMRSPSTSLAPTSTPAESSALPVSDSPTAKHSNTLVPYDPETVSKMGPPPIPTLVPTEKAANSSPLGPLPAISINSSQTPRLLRGLPSGTEAVRGAGRPKPHNEPPLLTAKLQPKSERLMVPNVQALTLAYSTETTPNDLPRAAPLESYSAYVQTPATPQGHQPAVTALPNSYAPRMAVQLVTHAVQSGSGTTQILLNPEELGRVRMTLTTTETGIAVTIIAERPETADLMRRHSDLLTKEFEDLGQGDVAFNFDGEDPKSGDTESNSIISDSPQDMRDLPETPNVPILSSAVAGGLDLKL